MRARTTVRLDKHLLKDAKRYALEKNKTLTAVIEEALRKEICDKEEPIKKPFVLVTSPGKVRDGIDISNSSQLQDIMDGLIDIP